MLGAISVAAVVGLVAGGWLDAIARRLPPGLHDPGAPAPLRVALVAASTAVLWVVAVLAGWDEPVDVALGVALVTLLVPVVLIDLEHRLVLDVLTIPAAVLALVIGLVLDPGGVPEQLVAGAAAGGFLLVAALLKPGGMGLGDVKLAAVMGLYLGRAVAPAVVVALLTGVLAGGLLLARAGATAGRGATVPFAPFLAFGALVGLVAGTALTDAYVDAI